MIITHTPRGLLHPPGHIPGLPLPARNPVRRSEPLPELPPSEPRSMDYRSFSVETVPLPVLHIQVLRLPVHRLHIITYMSVIQIFSLPIVTVPKVSFTFMDIKVMTMILPLFQ